jgi:glycosyltransferase involved in cell wall biosynthesis
MDCRILYLVGQLGLGGLERQLCYLIQGIDRERYMPEVVVWNYFEKDQFVSKLRGLGVPVHHLPNTPSRVLKLRALRQMIRKLQPRLVHSYSFFTNFAAWWATQGSKAIAIGSIRNNFVSDRREAGKVLGTLSARWPAVQVCNSIAATNEVKDSLWPFKPTYLHLVRNRLDIERFRNVPLSTYDPTILAVGRLYPGKRWDRLLRTIALVASQGVQFSVRHVGDGPLLGILKAQAKSLGVDGLIEFLGPRNSIVPLMEESMFLVHTADDEGCPNVVMEAMACGRAVVATDAGDVPYLVEDGKTGFVARRGDDAALADRVVRLITDPDLCRQMGMAGRAKAEREFGLDCLVAETMAAYRAAGLKD